MKSIFITLSLTLFISIYTTAQSFFVERTEEGFEKEIIQKLDFNGYKISNDKAESDFTVSYHFQKNKKNFKFESYLTVIKNSSNEEVYRSEIVKKAANAFNGYQAMPQIMAILTDKYLLPEIKNKLSKK